MNLSAHIRKITDKLSYNLLYAPDYPAEDKTSLDNEEQLIKKWLAVALSACRREDVGDWIGLGEKSVIKAFNHFRSGEELAGSREVQSASEYLHNAVSQKPFKVDLVGRPDGTVKKAQE